MNDIYFLTSSVDLVSFEIIVDEHVMDVGEI